MPYLDDLLPFLRANPLFEGVSESELPLLLPFLKVAYFEIDSTVIHEGDKGEELYLIKSGSVDVLKKDEEGEKHHSINTLHAGEWFGEMSLFDPFERAATVHTLEPTELIVFSPKPLNLSEGGQPIYAKIMGNLTKKISQRLKNSNETVVKSLEKELLFTKTHDHIGQFIIHLFILLTFYFYMFKAFERYAPESMTIRVISAVLIVCFGISAILIIKQSHYPLKFYGLTLKNCKKNALEAVIFTLPILVIMLLFKWFLIHNLSEFKNLSLFQFGPQTHPILHFFGGEAYKTHFFVMIGLYIVLAPLQEFIARGCLQSSLENFFSSPRRVFLAILTSNLLFGMFHSLKTFSFMFAAFLLGLFWGWLYSRQRSIIGVSISHALIGIWAFLALNYERILIY